jgi:hypothetical protein
MSAIKPPDRAFTSCNWLRTVAARGPGSTDRWIRACSPATIGFMSSQWKKVAYLAVGGLTELGFAAGSLLLVVSHQGRGVVDLASGELLARDRHETGAWFDAARRAALGIGPLLREMLDEQGFPAPGPGRRPGVPRGAARACHGKPRGG